MNTLGNKSPATKNVINCPDWCGSFGWASSCKAKGHWFDSQPGRMPGLQV